MRRLCWQPQGQPRFLGTVYIELTNLPRWPWQKWRVLEGSSARAISGENVSTRPHTSSAKPDVISTIQLVASQRRWVSKARTAEDDSQINIEPWREEERGEDEKDPKIVYHGPIPSTVRKLLQHENRKHLDEEDDWFVASSAAASV